jgi:hypothetical protein
MMPSIYQVKRSTELLPPFRAAHRCNHQALPIRGEGEGGVGIDVEELKDTAVNHQSETISMLGQMLDHVESRSLIVITMYHLSDFRTSGGGRENPG